MFKDSAGETRYVLANTVILGGSGTDSVNGITFVRQETQAAKGDGASA